MSGLNVLGRTALFIALLLSVPILVIVAQLFVGSTDIWAHLLETVFADYVKNTFSLMFGVGIGVVILGVSSAWLTTSCEFPGRKVFSLLLLLPLAMPAYIIAYTYTGLFDFAGPVQSTIRELTGLRYGEYWFFEIRSIEGAMFMLALVLYPYVYLMARAAFLNQSAQMLEVSQSLGLSPLQGFFRVVLPMARPAIIAGLTLALMETLADYGTVQYFGVSTFTTGIFRTYYGFGDIVGAAQLAVALLSFVFVLIIVEKYSRRKINYYSASEHRNVGRRLQLSTAQRWLAFSWCAGLVFFGFALPASVLLFWAAISTEVFDGEFAALIWNSFSLASIAAFVSVALALVLAYAVREQKNKWVRSAVQLTSLGYALPGTIIAIGVIMAFAWFDNSLLTAIEKYTDRRFGLFLSGTLVALVFAYTIRFLAISLGSIQSGLTRIKPSIDQSGRLLGLSASGVIRRLHVPLLRTSVLTAFLIVFVDVLKELPTTLILRPFNFNTLAVRAYELASDERLVDAAPASITIVLVGLLPVFLLNRSITKS